MEINIKILLIRSMILIREFEKFVSSAKLRNEILGQVHTCIGQEAVIVGSCIALNKEDYIISTHRSHGHVLAKGANIKQVMAELYGKSTGTNGGKGGSMHIFDKEVGSICTTAIVGSGLPIGLGASFASKFLNDGKITLVFFGDGATNEGTFGESLNLAATLKLPIIFLLENNGIAITTNFDSVTLNTDIYKRAISYGIKSFQIDGQDVEATYNVVKQAIGLIKDGQGPIFIEAKTIRFNEHAEGAHYAKFSDCGYRNKDEIELLKVSSDPIIVYSNDLINQKVLSKEYLEEMIFHASQEVQDALKFAIESPLPSLSDAYSNIYV